MNRSQHLIQLCEATKKCPKIFYSTIYRLPTDEELDDVNSFNLSAKEIIDGFSYTIIGRGMRSKKNSEMIIECLTKLSNKFPDNQKYVKALNTYEAVK